MTEHKMTLSQMELEIEHGGALFLIEPFYDQKQNVLLGTQKVLTLKDINRIKRLFPEKTNESFLVKNAVPHYIDREKRVHFTDFVVQTIKKDEYFRKFTRDQREFVRNHVNNLLPENDYLIWKLSKMRSFSGFLFLHSVRVTMFSLVVYYVYSHQQKSGMLDAEIVRQLMEAAFLHDLGYLQQDIQLVETKKMDLTEEQSQKLSQHPIDGFKMIRQESSRHDLDTEVLNVVLNHEERLDGSGEPRGIGAEDLDLMTRIVTVCNYFDSLIREQWSATAHPIKDYIRKIRSQKEKFDTNVMDALLETFRLFFHQS